MSYVSYIDEPKLPWSWRRTFDMFKTFFTGIVPPIAKTIVEQRLKNWVKLTEEKKRELIAWVNDRADGRRASMYETATRTSYILVGVALVAGFGIGLLAAKTAITSNGEVLLRWGFRQILFATALSLYAMASKWKVMKRPRATGESEADERLAKMVAIVEVKVVEPGMELYEEYEEAALRLHKRKIILTVERRAQLVSCVIAVSGIFEMMASLKL